MKVVIVGGVAAGAGAAAKARRTNEDCEIVMFERGGYVSFANCGLPYYIGGVIEDRDELLQSLPGQGVGLVMNPGCSLENSRQAIQIAEKYDFVYAAV